MPIARPPPQQMRASSREDRGKHSPDLWRLAMAILALAVALRIFAWLVKPDLWLDEAMLYQAIKDQAILVPWVPLTQYTQITPFLLTLVWKAIVLHFGVNELLLRAPSLIAGIAGLWVLWLALRNRLGPTGTAAALLLAGFSATAILQTAQLKPYSFEFLASALILRAAIRLVDMPGDRRTALHFAGVSVAALTFTYTSPITTTACGLGIVASLVASKRLSGTTIRQLAPWAVLWATIAVAWQIWVVNPSTLLQFVGNDRSYASEYLVLSQPETWHHIGRVLNALDPSAPIPHLARLVTVVACLAWAAGIGLGWRRRAFEHAAFFGALSCLIALSAARYFPLAEPRKFIFLLPIFALSFGAAIEDLANRIPNIVTVRPRLNMMLLAIALTQSPFALLASVDSRKEQVHVLLTATPQGACPLVWTYYMAWPAIETYRDRRPDIVFIGQIPTASSTPSWSWRVREIFPDYVGALTDQMNRNPGLCLLFSHIDAEERRREKNLMLAAIAPHRCSAIVAKTGATLYRCE